MNMKLPLVLILLIGFDLIMSTTSSGQKISGLSTVNSFRAAVVKKISAHPVPNNSLAMVPDYRQGFTTASTTESSYWTMAALNFFSFRRKSVSCHPQNTIMWRAYCKKN